MKLRDLLKFDGADYVPPRDDVRLTGQLRRVWEMMADNQPHTLAEIEAATGDPQASISAQLRHLRKERFGGFTVEREHLGNGLYTYRLLPPLGGQFDLFKDAPF